MQMFKFFLKSGGFIIATYEEFYKMGFTENDIEKEDPEFSENDVEEHQWNFMYNTMRL